MISSVWPTRMLVRQADAVRINEIINDPAVRPFIGGSGPIDLTTLVADRGNVVLCGEHGGAVFHRLLPGLYELHTSILTSGRGRWTLRAAAEAFFFMFTQTDCVEIVTKVPDENRPALAAAKLSGMTLDWVSPRGWERNGESCAVPIYSLRVADWPDTCPAALRPIGEWFHDSTQAQLKAQGRPPIEHAEDPFHDVVAGAVVAMIHGGQIMKGITYYNRRAGVAKTPYMRLVSAAPLVLDLHDCRVRVADELFEVL